MKMPTAFYPLRERWATASLREQRLLRSAGLLVGLALVWWLLVAPPLRTFTQGQAERLQLDMQWQKIQNLQRQAAALQALPKISRDAALRALDATVKLQFGTSAQLSVLGDNVTVSLRNTPAHELAQWLPQARLNARAIPSEARLLRSNSNPPGQAVWSGTIVMRLPPQ